MSDLWAQGDERHQVETSVGPLSTRVECLSSWPLPYFPMKVRAQSKMAFREDQGYVSVPSLLEPPTSSSMSELGLLSQWVYVDSQVGKILEPKMLK